MLLLLLLLLLLVSMVVFGGGVGANNVVHLTSLEGFGGERDDEKIVDDENSFRSV